MDFLNDGIEYKIDKQTISSLLDFAKYFMPNIYHKMHHDGRLFGYLINNIYGMKSEDKEVIDYQIAAYFADMSYVMLDKYIYKGNQITEHDKKLILRHTELSSGYFLGKEGMGGIAEIIKYHHEKPDASGIFKVQNTNNKALGILNISNEFIDAMLPHERKPEFPATPQEAITIALKGYETNLLFDEEEKQALKRLMMAYHEEYIS